MADLLDRAKNRHIGVLVQAGGTIELRRAGFTVATAIPLIGIPEAFTIQEHEERIDPKDLSRSMIIYDGLGVRPSWASHLKWLNRHHRLQTSQVADIGQWLGGLS